MPRTLVFAGCICHFQALSCCDKIESYFTDYGDEEVDELIDHFGLALEQAGTELAKIEPEWTKLKQNVKTRYKIF